MSNTLACSGCGGVRDREGQRLCAVCHATYQREWKRKKTREHRELVRGRSRISAWRGKLKHEPCTVCGNPNSELHHPDHEMPNLTVWLCRRHHMLWHDHWKATVLNVFCQWLEIARECAEIAKKPAPVETTKRDAA